jgi:hypothetical protein
MELDKEKLKHHLKFMIPVLQREIVIGQTSNYSFIYSNNYEIK